MDEGCFSLMWTFFEIWHAPLHKNHRVGVRGEFCVLGGVAFVGAVPPQFWQCLDTLRAFSTHTGFGSHGTDLEKNVHVACRPAHV
jgi:hypothetical protein